MCRCFRFCNAFLFLPVIILHSCHIRQNVRFSDTYIKDHRGKFEVYVPEVHELANILIALSSVGQADSNMTDMTTVYYRDVMTHFGPFMHHPIVDTINTHILKPKDARSYWYYYALKMNACGYDFNSENKIVHSGPIQKMGFSNMYDPIRRHEALITDFAEKTDFRAFYSQHKTYYDSLISTYRKFNPIDKMQGWLEKKFGFGYGQYCVYFSPLVGGAHATQKYHNNHFEQTAMFVCRSTPSSKYNRNVNEMNQSRVVFTEIDHNFVNPLSDKHRKSINKVFSDRKLWVDDSAGNLTDTYDNAYAIFNEYMTFALFSLYCLDNFPESDVKTFIPKMEKQMVEKRHFIRFAEFNQQLMTLYNTNKAITIEELYRQILQYSEKNYR
ncbi:MAG: DUF4932 domain-containing protein [Bacteroidetes bacterium]|nr:DUF4932 domain-containing protein [Bacteroidota bacterium]